MSVAEKPKPCDLTEIRKVSVRERTHAAATGAPHCAECMALRAELADYVPTMADEIEALREERRILRETMREALDALEDGTGPDEWTERARELLPAES
jgi:HAMP domain-containing protein